MFSVASPRLSQLSIGVSMTSIRYGSSAPRGRVRKFEEANFPDNHGEEIWVWSHMMTKQVIYSNTKVLQSHRALRQLPFNGKKCKPAKLRKDYWEPMAMIQLPKGAGAAGASVFQKLREFRRMHELCWGDEIYYKTRVDDEDPNKVKKIVRNRWERGQALNDQRANTIADMAAALAGKGRGNRMFVSRQELEELEEGNKLVGRKWLKIWQWRSGNSSQKELEGTRLAKGGKGAVVTEADRSGDLLLPVKVYWAVDTDKNYADAWSPNVTHELLDNAVLLEGTTYGKERISPTDGSGSYGADDIDYKIKKIQDDV